MSSIAWALLGLAATASAVYTVRTARPVRRLPGESWLSIYFRVYWNPGTAIVIALVSWGIALGMDSLSDEASWTTFAIGVATLLLVTLVAVRDRQDLGAGPAEPGSR